MWYLIGVVLFLLLFKVFVTIIYFVGSILMFVTKFMVLNLHISVPLILIIMSLLKFGLFKTLSLIAVMIAAIVITAVIIYNVDKRSKKDTKRITPLFVLGRAISPKGNGERHE